MSKNSLRFDEASIAGGRFGTARVHGSTLTLSEPVTPLESGETRVSIDLTVRPALLPALTARDASRALGRMKTGSMNKTEQAYADYLDAQRHAGQVLWHRFEGIKLRLADNTFYTPDFAVMGAAGELELHEVKGFMEEDANVKIKVAAAQYPFVFRIVRKAKGGNWDIREV